MKLLPLKTAEEMEAEYRARLKPSTLRVPIIAIGLALLVAVMVWGSFQGYSGGGRTEPPDQHSW